MSDKAAIVKILDRAAKLCEEGWCQGVDHNVVDGKDCYCLFKAVRKARHEIDSGRPLEDICDLIIRAISKPRNIVITEYNDTPGRTQQEVVDTLRAVARKVEAEL